MKALVVGGRGLMGQWFCAFLAGEGYAVSTLDPRGAVKGHGHAKSLARGLEGLGPRDVVLAATPMAATAGVLAEVRAIGTEALVMDICSIKAPVEAELRALAAEGSKVASLHPMWGPDAMLLSDKNLLVLDCGHAGAARAAKALFKGTAVRIRTLPLGEHDRTMGWALGLPHALNLAFGLALARSGLPHGQLRELGGPTMTGQLRIAEGVARENKDLYHGIQAFNPLTPEVHAALRGALRELEGSLRDPEEFKALMARCEAYFAAPRAAPRARGRRRA